MDILRRRLFPNNTDRINLGTQPWKVPPMPAANQMHAAVLEAPNASFKLAKIARPIPRPDEVLVRIMASGVNPLDLKIQAGQAPHARQPLPAVLGIDLAGIVEAVGRDVSG